MHSIRGARDRTNGTALAHVAAGRPTDRSPAGVESSVSFVHLETRDEVRKACRYPVRVAARVHAWRRSDALWGRHEHVPPFLARRQLRSSSPKLQNASCFWSFWLSTPDLASTAGSPAGILAVGTLDDVLARSASSAAHQRVVGLAAQRS